MWNGARAILETQGYTVVRAGGSFGLFDLVAFSRAGLHLIQVKANRIPTRREFARLQLFDNLPAGATKEIWRFFDREAHPEIVVLRLSQVEKLQRSGLMEVKEECQQPTRQESPRRNLLLFGQRAVLPLRGSTAIRF